MAELNRQKRLVLRHVQDHFNVTRKRRGVLFEQASTVDIYHHPRDAAALYNYVTPRRGVAWVPGTDVKVGLDRLAALERIPRLEVVKGLFPPAFHAQLKKMGLDVESDYPLLTYGSIPDCEQVAEDIRPVPSASRDLAVYGVADQNGVARWISLTLEGRQPDPTEVRRAWENVLRGHEMYFLVSHELTLAGGACVIMNPPVAQIMCADTIMPYRRRGVASAAIRMALQFAQARDCSLIYMVAANDAAARLYRRLGSLIWTTSSPTADLRPCCAAQKLNWKAKRSMPETWHSLYLRSDDTQTITAALIDSLHHYSYQRYDPFAGGTGTPPGLKTFVKHFVAPPVDGWLRILGEPDPKTVIDLSKGRAVLHAWLTNDDGGIMLYRDGQASNAGLSAFLRPGKSADDLQRAQAGSVPVSVDKLNSTNSTVPTEMQQLARDHNVNPEQANKMIERFTTRLFGKLDRASDGEASDMQAQARALATGANRLDWNSEVGRRLKALAGVLDLPSNWREPDFETIRQAYQAARYLRKSPSARLMSDEQDALKALPDAIRYEAIYVGK